jgi:hypothetical protein
MTSFIQMVPAELLRLRRNTAMMTLAGVLTIGVVVLYFGVSEIEHLSDPGSYGPAGGIDRFNDATILLSIWFGALAAILVGTEAGTSDLASGVFRDMVVTGRERLWLFAVRVPAALIVTLGFGALALALSLGATYAFAGSGGGFGALVHTVGAPGAGPLAAPGAGYAIDSVLWVVCAEAILCVVAVGLGSLTGSRAASLTMLIGWQLIAGRLLARIAFLGSARDLMIPNVALGSLKPGQPLPDTGGLTMSAGAAVVVLALWLGGWLVAGAWRTRTRDA